MSLNNYLCQAMESGDVMPIDHSFIWQSWAYVSSSGGEVPSVFLISDSGQSIRSQVDYFNSKTSVAKFPTPAKFQNLQKTVRTLMVELHGVGIKWEIFSPRRMYVVRNSYVLICVVVGL